MRALAPARPDRRLPLAVVGTVALAALAVASISSTTAQAADADTRVPLGTAGSFGVLAGEGITNDGVGTTIDGDVGSYETTTVTGLTDGPPPTPDQVINGVIRRAGVVMGDEEIMQIAKNDLEDAYDDAAASLELAAPDLDETELGGKTLTAGVYENPTLGLTGTVTLDGGNADGSPSDSVFVFKTGTAGSTLITGTDSAVELTGGAQACNVFWQVQSSATFGAGTDFVGTVMALTSISAQDGATFDGRLLARNGAVTLLNNTITSSECEQAAADDDGDTTDGTDTDTGGTDTDTDTGDDSDTSNGGIGTDSDTGTSGGGAAGSDGSPGLPSTGGPSPWLALLAASGVLGGTALVRRRRYLPTHSA